MVRAANGILFPREKGGIRFKSSDKQLDKKSGLI
jgi:hypothetical protein